MQVHLKARRAAIGLAFFACITLSAEPAPQDFAGHGEMSGMHLSDFPEFNKTWHEVTVRFRKDTGELRFVYANDAAWRTLSQNRTDYADGAIFAKIAVATNDDPSFPTSAVPGGVRRYQLMVRNKKMYAETDGWGYALFDNDGLTFPENPKNMVLACAACHRIVRERGEVFSQPMQISPFSPLLSTPLQNRRTG